MSARFDVVVVGAGPAGMAAATVAADAGSRVCLLDDNPALGGQIWRGLNDASARDYPHGKHFMEWSARLHRTSCAQWQGWQVIDRPAAHCLRVERGSECRDIGFGKLILATGARERFLPFPGWTLPGVMGAGGVQALVKYGLDAKGKRVVLSGSGPLLLAVAAALQSAGAHVIAVYEQAPMRRLARFGVSLLRHPSKLIEAAHYRSRAWGVPYKTNHWIVRADGRDRVENVTVTDGRKQRGVDCDWLGCGFNLVPNLELPRLFGCRIDGGFVAVNRHQQSSISDVACIGELTGIGGVDKAILEGRIAGWAAAGRETEAHALQPQLRRLRRFTMQLDQAFVLRPELRRLALPETLICRCEDVPSSALESCANWREAKLHTRCGMGACQGRVCGTAAEFLFGWQHTGGRPPILPAAFSSMAKSTDVDECESVTPLRP